MDQIYLDYNASTPIAPEVARVIETHLAGGYGNPSALHWAAAPARKVIEDARAQVAELLGSAPEEVVFTSGGTESINHAIKGRFYAAGGPGAHIITASCEHPAVLSTCAFLERQGAKVTYLPVDRTCRIAPEAVEAAITDRTILVSLMHANGEVGTVQPIAEVSRITRPRGIPLHVDASQSAGKIDIDVDALGADLLTLAGHKMYAPKGVGALYVRTGARIESLIHGADHQAGRRAGTEGALMAAAMGAAAMHVRDLGPMDRVRRLRDALLEGLRAGFHDRVTVNGHPEHRLPNTLHVSFPGQIGADILERMPQVAATTGSACHEGVHEMSPVLAAMGLSEAVGLGAIRFSLGRMTTDTEIAAVPSLLARGMTR